MRPNRDKLVVLLFVAVLFALATGCAGTHLILRDAPPVEKMLTEQPRVMFVGAHPDDESLAGAILAKACVELKNPCHFLVFTRGEGGECDLDGGCQPNLATVRLAEMQDSAKRYNATLEIYEFPNAPLPVSSFPTRQEVEKLWMQKGDPVGIVARAIRRFKPTIIITFDPDNGFTGHPEHQAVSRFVLAGARLANDPNIPNPFVAGLEPFKVARVWQVLNRYWFMVGPGLDPEPYSDLFDPDQSCGKDEAGEELTCKDIMMNNTHAHKTQDNDMGNIRFARGLLNWVYLRRVRPEDPAVDPWLTELGQ